MLLAYYSFCSLPLIDFSTLHLESYLGFVKLLLQPSLLWATSPSFFLSFFLIIIAWYYSCLDSDLLLKSYSLWQKSNLLVLELSTLGFWGQFKSFFRLLFYADAFSIFFPKILFCSSSPFRKAYFLPWRWDIDCRFSFVILLFFPLSCFGLENFAYYFHLCAHSNDIFYQSWMQYFPCTKSWMLFYQVMLPNLYISDSNTLVTHISQHTLPLVGTWNSNGIHFFWKWITKIMVST